MSVDELKLSRGHVAAVLLANAILWVGAILLADIPRLGSVALLSIASLLLSRRRAG